MLSTSSSSIHRLKDGIRQNLHEGPIKIAPEEDCQCYDNRKIFMASLRCVHPRRLRVALRKDGETNQKSANVLSVRHQEIIYIPIAPL